MFFFGIKATETSFAVCGRKDTTSFANMQVQTANIRKCKQKIAVKKVTFMRKKTRKQSISALTV